MEKSKKKSRRAKGSGRIFKKISGNYCVQFKDVSGKLKTIALKDELKQPIRDKKRAEVVAQEELKLYHRLQDVETKNEFLAKIATHKEIINQVIIKPEDAWEAYLKDQSRPDSGESTLKRYRSPWNIFVNWLKEKRPQIRNISNIDEQTAEAFMNHIWNTGMPLVRHPGRRQEEHAPHRQRRDPGRDADHEAEVPQAPAGADRASSGRQTADAGLRSGRARCRQAGPFVAGPVPPHARTGQPCATRQGSGSATDPTRPQGPEPPDR